MLRKHTHFRRTRFWWSYFVGGGYDHPTRGMGGMPSIWQKFIRWKLYTFKDEYTLWEWMRPPNGQRSDTHVRVGDDMK